MRARRLVAEVTGAELVTIPGGGHNPLGRYPAKTNALIVDFLDRRLGIAAPAKQASRATGESKKALYLSSPIGLGHGRRDIAIARELRKLHPDLQVDWLAQDPVTRLLEANGERVHPLSARLASETRHIELESGEHDLHCFQAIRRMDEVLIKNFMIFQDAVDQGGYDLVIADEAWDIDHYWHEHPELKKAKLAWFTDFVGYVPMPSGGEHEAFLTADYNAEMIEHIERHPGVRDRAIFVGKPEDIVPLSFGKDLPAMRDWVPKHFDFAGYIIGEHPADVRQPRGVARRASAIGRRARLHRHGRRIGRRRASDQAHPAELSAGAGEAARAAHDRGGGPAHRSRLAQRAGRRRGARVRAGPRPPSRRLRSGARAGRAHHLHGAGGGRHAVPLFPAARTISSRISTSRTGSTAMARDAHGVRDLDAGDDRRRHGRGMKRADRIQAGRSRRCGARGAHAGGI